MAPKSNKRVAVAYLVRHPEFRPEGSKKLIEKIVSYDRQVTELNRAVNEAAVAIHKMQDQFNQSLGAMEVLIDIVAEGIPDDKAKEWSEIYMKEQEESDAKG